MIDFVLLKAYCLSVKTTEQQSTALLTDRNKTYKKQTNVKALPNEKETIEITASVPSENVIRKEAAETTNANVVTSNGNEVIAEQTKTVKDTTTNTEAEVTAKDTAAIKADTTNTLKIAVSKPKTKLQWRARAAAGVSGIATSAFKFLPVASSGVNTDAQSLFDQTASLNFGNGPSNAVVNHNPEVYSSFSFSAGADVRKNVTGRLDITAGLGYSYYSTAIYIGSKINAATTLSRVNEQVKVNDYFLASGINKERYTNQYHYIELPIGLDWKVLKKKPLQWHSGVTISHLIATNALYYSNQQNVYYKDEGVFNKTQFSLFTDLSYRIIKLKSGALYAGPQLQLGLSNLLKKEAYGTQHLFFAGLNTHFDF